MLQTLAYTPVQNTRTQNIQTGLTINTLHSNALSNYTTSRNLSRPPFLQVQIQRLPSILQQLIINSTLQFFLHLNHQI